MPIQIEVQDIHAQLLIDFYVSRLKALKNEIIQKEKETKEINAIIQKLRQKNQETPVIGDARPIVTDYSDKWPWVRKVRYAIEYQGKPLTTKDIVDTLTEFEPSFLADRKRAVASVSSILSIKSGENKPFSRVTNNDSGDFAYKVNDQKDSVITNAEIIDEDDDKLPF